MHSNSVELIGWYGGDEAIACSGWTSTSRELSEEKKGRMGKFILDLWNAEPVPHGTPFEKGIVHFMANTDIATHIQLLKHRMASINGESARYKELKEDKYYLPEDWKNTNLGQRAGFVVTNKVGEIRVNLNSQGHTWDNMLELYTMLGNLLYHEAIADLTKTEGRKRAKESARFFKTYSMQYQVDIMFNMRSFANFLKQRKDKHAQLEIREVAAEMLRLVENIEGEPFKYTLQAITK